VWPIVAAVVLGPFVLTAIGMAVAAWRFEPKPAVRPPIRVPAPAVILPLAPTTPEVPEPVEPGESRKPPPGYRPAPVVPKPPPELIPVAAAKGPKCERFGTAIDFVRSPALACDRAAREQKLVMVLHLAGYFDDPGFT
jgi:hypothetical protein